ncbi:MAG: hypothetical protein HY645_03585 [Acidobacteria bacterium]|nr:hypothetical protein [Acidobacteriota bacterium]
MQTILRAQPEKELPQGVLSMGSMSRTKMPELLCQERAVAGGKRSPRCEFPLSAPLEQSIQIRF